MISVIVPVYNTATYLMQCVMSIRSQTVSDLEVLLVDDGSTDGSGALCDALALQDSRIRVIHQENAGLSAARNTGISAARGQYLSFVDSDDWIEPGMLEILLSRLEETGADMALCNLRQEPGTATPMEAAVLDREAFLSRLTLPEAWYYVTVPNRLYRRELFAQLRFPPGLNHEDEATVHRLAARCRRIVLEPDALYHYRRRGGSITSGSHIPDKLAALADRVAFSRKLGWKSLCDATSVRFSEGFLEYYQGRDAGMEAALKLALPVILASGSVRPRHKVYLIGIQVAPGLFLRLRSIKRGRKS